MKTNSAIHLSDVKAVYSGAEGRLWELIMGEQVHIGGFVSSMELAKKASIRPGSKGADFCCCNGAGMRFLVRFCGVGSMTGVDATKTVLEQCRHRCIEQGLIDKISYVEADVCKSELEDNAFDFAWGEDAWCYVDNKKLLIEEAVRITKPGGTIAFTDWLEGPVQMSDEESHRFLSFMKFPNIVTLSEYRSLLESNGCSVLKCEYTGRFAPCMDMYLQMVMGQLKYDVLKVIQFDMQMFDIILEEMRFMRQLAHEGKIIQGLLVGIKG